MATLATLVVELVGKTDDFEKAMQGAAGRVSKIGDTMAATGKSLTAGITLPLGAAAVGVTHFANKFNAGMANVASLGSEAAAKVGEWGPMVQQLAIDVGKGTGDMTDGLYNVVSAFGATDESMQILEINAKAATAGLSTTSEAIALTSAVTKGYGDTSAAAVSQVSDLALKTVQLGQTTFPELAASVGSVTPLAASLGVSMEEMFGVMATGTGVTGTASEVSTQLRGILQSLMAPTGSMTDLMTELGFANGEAMLQSLGLQGTIEAVTQAAEATGQPLQSYIGSIEGQTLAMALAGPQADVFSEKLDAMSNAAGATAEAFAAQTEGVNATGFAMSQAKVQAQVWAEQIGSALVPLIGQLLERLGPVVDFITQLIERFTAASPVTQNLIIAFLAFAAAIGPILIFVGTLASSIGGLMAAWAALGPVIAAITPILINLGAALVIGWTAVVVIFQSVVAFLLGPFGLALAAVAVLIAGFVAAYQTNFAGFADFLNQIWASIQTAFQAFISLFQGDFEGFLTGISEAWEMAWTAVVDFITGLWDLIQPHIQAVIDGIVSFFTETDWAQLGHDLILKIVEALATFAEQAGATISGWFAVFSDWVGGIDWYQIGYDIVFFIVDGLLTFVETVAETLNSWWAAFEEWRDGRSWLEIGSDIVVMIIDGLLTFIDTVSTTLNDWWAAFEEWRDGRSWLEIGSDIVVKIIDGLKTFVAAVAAPIQEWYTTISTKISQLDLKSLGADIVDGIVKGLEGAAASLATAASNMAAGAVQAVKDALSIRSPSRVFMELGAQTGAGMAIGLVRSSGDVINAVSRMAEGVKTEGAKAFTDALGAVIGVMQDGMKFLDDLALFDFDLKMWEFDLKIANLATILSFSIKRMAAVAKGMSGEMVKHTGEYAKALGTVVKTMSDGMKFLVALVEFQFDMAMWQYNQKMQNLAGILGFAITHMAQAAKFMSGSMVKHTGEYAKALGTVLKTMGEGIKFLDALQGLELEEGVRKYSHKIDMIVSLSGDLMRQMAELSKLFEVELIEHTEAFAKAVQQVLKVTKPAVESIGLINEFIPAENLKQKVDQFAHDLVLVAVTMIEGLNSGVQFAEEAIDKAAVLANRMGNIMEIVEPGLASVTQIAAFVKAEDFEEKAAQFGVDLITVLNLLLDALENGIVASLEAVEDASQMSLYIGNILEVIEPAASALDAISTFVSDNGLTEKVLQFSHDLLMVIEQLVATFNEAQTRMDEEALTNAVAFAGSVQSLSGVTAKIVEDMGKIGASKMPSIDKPIEWLKTNVPILANTLTETQATLGSTVVQAAIDFRENAALIVENVLAGLDSLAQFMTANAAGSLQSILNDMLSLLANTVNPAEIKGTDIGKAIGDGIASGINAKLPKIKKMAEAAALAALNSAQEALGIASPSKLARDLVGAQFIEGIAVGLRDVSPITQAITDGLQSGLIDPAVGAVNNSNVTTNHVTVPGGSGASLYQQLRAIG